MSQPTVKRSDFIRRFVQQGGLSYLQAERAYGAMMGLMEDSVSAKQSVNMGRVGILVATETRSKKVSMGFRRVGGDVEKCKREFYIGPRTKYVFRLHRTFGRQHGLVP